MTDTTRPRWIWITSLTALLFGLMTLKEGGAVLFFDGTSRQAASHYVPFILWFNFLSGFFYVITGAGLWLRKRWAVKAAIALAVAIPVAFAALGLHILNNGEYEMRTVIAMTIRSGVWITIALISWYFWDRIWERAAE